MSVVFPTHVGVFLLAIFDGPRRPRLPHARGGVSTLIGADFRDDLSSPRTWGCFRSSLNTGMSTSVFPTHVGVFLVRAIR